MNRWLITLFLTCVTIPVYAESLVDAKFESTQDSLDFIFSVPEGEEKLSPTSIKYRVEGTRLLIIEVMGFKTKREYKKWSDPWIKRVLIYPSKKSIKSYLKVRMNRRIPSKNKKGILVDIIEDQVRVRFPKRDSLLQKTNVEENKEKTEMVLSQEESQEESQDEPEETSQEEETTTETPQPEEEDEDSSTTDKSEDSTSEASDPPEVTAAPDTHYKKPEAHAPSPVQLKEIHESTALSQIHSAMNHKKVPKILSLPFGKLKGGALNHPNLGLLPQLSQKLIHNQMLHQTETIWIHNEKIEEYALHLQDQDQQLSLDQARSLAELEGVDFVLIGGLRFEPEPSKLLRLNTMLISVKDPEVKHEVNYLLSYPHMQAVLNKALIKETRGGAIWRATLFPGLGHIYRKKFTHGWTYLTAGVTLFASALGSSVMGYLAEKDYKQTDYPSTAHRRQDANAHYDRANLLWIGFASVWITSWVNNYLEAKDLTYIKDSQIDFSHLEVYP